MTSVQLKDLKGKAVGEVALDEHVFGIEPNVHLIHAALHRQLVNARSGSANTKTRAEVRGGGRKPWRQKGTGRARAGSIRSPLWNGGGVIFGPKPRDYSQSLPKKARQLALRSALAARRDQLVIVQNFDGLFKNPPKAGHEGEVEQPKTKLFASTLKDLGLDNKCVLLVLDNGVPGFKQIERAARNMPSVCVMNVSNLNVKQLMESEVVLASERTLELVNNRFRAVAAGGPEGSATKAESKKAKAEKAPSAEKKESKSATKKAEPSAKAEAKSTKTKSEPKEEKSSKTQKKSEK